MNRALNRTGALAVLALFALAGCDFASNSSAQPAVLPTPMVAVPPECNGQVFEATKRTVCQPFLSHWQQNGAIAIYGFPVSEQLQETDPRTGEVYIAQYFERARFELHADSGERVSLGRLGAMVSKPQPRSPAKSGAQFFPETGHNLKRAFLRFWLENGGLAQFGYPISEEQVETNPVDEKDYIVQYFERARFELHPDKLGTPFEVQLTPLGAQLYERTYSNQPAPDPVSATK